MSDRIYPRCTACLSEYLPDEEDRGLCPACEKESEEKSNAETVEHSLLLATAALEALAENPNMYPRDVILSRVASCKKALALTESGRRLLAEASR